MIPQSTRDVANRFAMLHPVVLLVAGLIHWPPEWLGVRAVLASLRPNDAQPADREGRAVGYYVELIEGTSKSRTTGGVDFQQAGVIRYLEDDFLLFELKPEIRRMFYNQPFETNAYGMHDDATSPEKPEGTFRIAVLGASMDMGWGVRYQDTYMNRLEAWLNSDDRPRAPGAPRRFEVLNFAVAAYSPLQRLETLRRKVLAFHPDLVIYSATTLDIRLMEIHLCELLRKRIAPTYDFVREAIERARLVDDDLRVGFDGKLSDIRGVKRKLNPSYWWLYDRTLGAIAAECRSAGVPMAMVIIPRVGSDENPEVRAGPVSRLRAMAAHNAVTAFDLSDAFDRDDPAAIEIAAWDDHPNATGHQRLFDALSRAIAADPMFAPLLLPPDRPTTGRVETGGDGPGPPS